MGVSFPPPPIRGETPYVIVGGAQSRRDVTRIDPGDQPATQEKTPTRRKWTKPSQTREKSLFLAQRLPPPPLPSFFGVVDFARTKAWSRTFFPSFFSKKKGHDRRKMLLHTHTQSHTWLQQIHREKQAKTVLAGATTSWMLQRDIEENPSEGKWGKTYRKKKASAEK